MKHLFLPLPIETVRRAWEESKERDHGRDEGIHLIEAEGGCFLVTDKKPPRVFVDLLKRFLANKADGVAALGNSHRAATFRSPRRLPFRHRTLSFRKIPRTP
jgi:hypothetical protein